MDPVKTAEAYKEKLLEYRRHIHAHPELSFKEVNTAAFIREKLAEANVPIMEGITPNSVVGVLDTGRPGKTVAFRADFDALPLEENNPHLPWRSQCPGVMHACGHDAHTAILLCFAQAMSKARDELCGKCIFLFQQGEEVTPGGAATMVADGAVKDADAVFALHVNNHFPAGTISCSSGPNSAACDTVTLNITSCGGHGAYPHTAPDPIACGAMIVNEIQYIVGRYRDPLMPLVITVGKFAAGRACNIIPEKAELLMTVRTYDAGLRENVEKWLKKAISSICDMHGCGYELDYAHGYPALINAESPVETVRAAARDAGIKFDPGTASMGGEDFAYFALAKPGCMFDLGSYVPKGGDGHSPEFDIDEACMQVGLAQFLAIYNRMQK